MARIAEQASNVSDWQLELGISMRPEAFGILEITDILLSYVSLGSVKSQASDRPEVADILDRNKLAPKRKTFAEKDKEILEEQESGTSLGESMKAVQIEQREKDVKNVWRSTEFLQLQSKVITWLLKRFLLFVMLTASVRADIIKSPENQVVLVNTNAIMECWTNSIDVPLTWSLNGKGSQEVSIFDGERVNPAYEEFFSVTPNAGRYDLHVKATTKMPKLKFKCTEPSADPVERSATLVVVESDPKCTTYNTANPEYIDIACTIVVSENWTPTMTWRANGIQRLTDRPTNQTTLLRSPWIEVTSTLYNVARKDARKYLCQTFFAPEMHEEQVTAGNVPNYMYFSMLLPDVSPSTQISTVAKMTTPTPNPTSNPWFIAFIAAMVACGASIVLNIGLIFGHKLIKKNPNGHSYHKVLECLHITKPDKEEKVCQLQDQSNSLRQCHILRTNLLVPE